MVASMGNAPVYGTSPKLALMPTTPDQPLGMRTEPPWSPPMAMSTSPVATSAALPPEDPPDDRDGSHGLRTGPVAGVWLPPEKQRSSQTALPAISPPASRMRRTTVASLFGTKPSRVVEPFIIATPATSTLSLMAMRLPASGPSSRSRTAHWRYQAPSGLPAGSGAHESRCGISGAC